MLVVAGRLDSRKGKTTFSPSSAITNCVTLSNLSFCLLFSSYINENNKNKYYLSHKAVMSIKWNKAYKDSLKYVADYLLKKFHLL